eukprot:3724461-Amphidinium_carterae.1
MMMLDMLLLLFFQQELLRSPSHPVPWVIPRHDRGLPSRSSMLKIQRSESRDIVFETSLEVLLLPIRVQVW